MIRLDAITVLKKNFPDAIGGISDHSETIYPCLGAVALGASIIESILLVQKAKGPDISASMDPYELRTLIKGAMKFT